MKCDKNLKPLENAAQCDIPNVMCLLGFTAHKWLYNNTKLRRTCKKCGIKQIATDYNGFYYKFENI